MVDEKRKYWDTEAMKNAHAKADATGNALKIPKELIEAKKARLRYEGMKAMMFAARQTLKNAPAEIVRICVTHLHLLTSFQIFLA